MPPNPNRKAVIQSFEGVNALIGPNLAKTTELRYAENARSVEIGTIEKRDGVSAVGSSLASTRDHMLYASFADSGSSNTGLYRVSTVGGNTRIYYLNSSGTWTGLSGLGTAMLELGDSTTQFDITNPSGTTFRYTWDGTGTDPSIGTKAALGSSVYVNAQNFSAANNGSFTVTAAGANYFEVTNASGVVESDKTVGTGSVSVVPSTPFSVTQAEGCTFIATGDHSNMYIDTDGVTVVDSSSAGGHLYYSPTARKINYYKDKLYVADFTLGTARYPRSVMMSSAPSGIVSLIDGDHFAFAGAIRIKVTDTSYIRVGDSLDVYRGFTFITSVVVSSKGEDFIVANSLAVDLLSADEVWVSGTFTGAKKFRWPDNQAVGIPVKQYDTFKLAGGSNSRIKMLTNIGNVMVIANEDNMATWDDYTQRNFDMGIGCVSDEGFTKHLGVLWFVHDTGIYATVGDRPELMSSPVERYFKGATKSALRRASMGFRGMSVFAYIPGPITLYRGDGSVEKVLSDGVILERDVRQKNWYPHTGVKADIMTNFSDNSGSQRTDRLLFTGANSSSDSGNYTVREFLDPSASKDVMADGVTQRLIPFRADTQRLYISGDISPLSYPKELEIEAERGNEIYGMVSLDDEPFYQLEGNAMKGLNVLKVTPKAADERIPSCRFVSVSMRDFSPNKCKVLRMTLRYTDSLDRPNDNPQGYGSV